MPTPTNSKPVTKRARKMARELQSALRSASQPGAPHAAPAGQAASDGSDKPRSKASLVLELLRRDGGATLEQLVAATGWLPHTTRAALTGIKKKGHALSSKKVDGIRTYRVASVGAAP